MFRRIFRIMPRKLWRFFIAGCIFFIVLIFIVLEHPSRRTNDKKIIFDDDYFVVETVDKDSKTNPGKIHTGNNLFEVDFGNSFDGVSDLNSLELGIVNFIERDVGERKISNTSLNLSTKTRNTDVHVYRRYNQQWIRDTSMCQVLPEMIVQNKESPVGTLQVYQLNDDVAKAELDFDGRILFGQIWKDVSKSVFKVLAPNRDIVLLDVGVGGGGYVQMAAQMGHRVIALDSNKDRIMEMCKSTIMSNMADSVTLIHQNLNDKNDDRMLNEGNHINLDSEITCSDRQGDGFHLHDVVEFKSLRKYTKFVIRLDTLVSGVDRLLFCGEEFFLHFDVTAVIMPWPDISDKHGMVNYLTKFHFKPFHASGNERPLQSHDLNYWPMNVMWLKTYEDQ